MLLHDNNANDLKVLNVSKLHSTHTKLQHILKHNAFWTVIGLCVRFKCSPPASYYKSQLEREIKLYCLSQKNTSSIKILLSWSLASKTLLGRKSLCDEYIRCTLVHEIPHAYFLLGMLIPPKPLSKKKQTKCLV